MAPAPLPPIVLLFTVAVAAVTVVSEIPTNPPVPVPVPLIVIAPTLLFEIGFELEVKSKMPFTCPVALSVTVIVDDPSKLPIVLPVTVPTSHLPAARNIPWKAEPLLVPVFAVLWLMPETVFP